MLELSEAGLDIICMDSDVTIGEYDSEIPEVGEEVGHDHAECAIELHSVFGGLINLV